MGKRFEVTVYDREKNEITYEHETNQYIAAVSEPQQIADDRLQHIIHIRTSNELHPVAIANICLALMEGNPVAKSLFRKAFEELKKKEGGTDHGE